MKLPISKLVNNTGQLQHLGIPKNYRRISKESFATLKENILADPDYLKINKIEVYEHDGKMVTISGNQRLRALKELGYTEIEVDVYPEDTSPELIRRRIIIANVSAGMWDGDIGNEYEWDELDCWGVSIKEFGLGDENNTSQELKIVCPTCNTKVSPDKIVDDVL